MTKEEFCEAHCANCGSQRCSGPNDSMAKGCPHYILEFERKDKVMKAKLIVEGKEFDIEINDPELQKLVAPEKKTGYERVVYGENFYCHDSDGYICSNEDVRGNYSQTHYDNANYYSDKTVAENNARADKLMRQLRRFAAFQRDESLNWNDENQRKYYIIYNYYNAELSASAVNCVKDAFNIYFHSESCVDAAIDLFHDELIWYFTKYKDSL